LFSNWQRELDRVPVRFSILLIQLLYGLCTSFPHLSCDLSCNIMWCYTVTSCHVTVTVWHLWHNTFLHLLLCSKSKIKEKKKKRNINNNLAILPSYDTPSLSWQGELDRVLFYFLYTTYAITAWSVHYFPIPIIWHHLVIS